MRLLAVAAAAGAFAAMATPAAAASDGWSGCYVGVNGGYGWSDAAFAYTKEDPPSDYGVHTATGPLAGGQAGCDLSTGSWVLGSAATFDWANITGSHDYFVEADESRESSKTSALETLTARVGYLVQPAFLIYAKGGVAWTQNSFEDLFIADQNATPSLANDTATGWTAGIGGEYRFAPKWSAFLEADYADFGTRHVTYVDGGSSFWYDVKQNLATVLFGINYRFAGR